MIAKILDHASTWLTIDKQIYSYLLLIAADKLLTGADFLFSIALTLFQLEFVMWYTFTVLKNILA